MARALSSLLRRWEPTRSLVIGCGAALLVVGGGTALSLMQVGSVKRDVATLAGDVHREREMIGEVGRTMARARTQLLKAAGQANAEGASEVTEAALEKHTQHLQDAANELRTLLTTDELPPWQSLDPDVRSAVKDFDEAVDALRAGDMAVVQEARDRIEPLAERVQVGLERVAEIHQQRVAAMLEQARDRLDTLWLLTAGLGGGAVLGLAAVWTVLLLRAAQRRRMLSEHLQHVHRVNADLEAFTGRVAHDLRNVLAPIAACPRLLARPDPGMADRVAAQLERSCRRAERMLETMLAFSRGGKPVGEASSSLEAAVSEVVGDLQSTIDAIGVDVDLDIQDAIVAMAPELLEVVLANVIGNAVKFLAGCQVRRVVVESTTHPDGVAVRVADTGPGIPASALPHIFEPFYRAGPSGVKGTGLGLATVQRIVAGHGGCVDLSSVVDEGTRFDLWLPTAPARSTAAAAVGGVASR